MSFWFTGFLWIYQGLLKNTTGLSGFKMETDTQVFGLYLMKLPVPERWF